MMNARSSVMVGRRIFLSSPPHRTLKLLGGSHERSCQWRRCATKIPETRCHPRLVPRRWRGTTTSSQIVTSGGAIDSSTSSRGTPPPLPSKDATTEGGQAPSSAASSGATDLSSSSSAFRTSALPPSPPPQKVQRGGGGNGGGGSVVDEKAMIGFKPNFKIFKVSYRTGDIETSLMSTSDLVRSSGIVVRDLVTLNLTSRRESRGQLQRAAVHKRTIGEIMPRNTTIVVSFGNIRAIVGLDHVFLADAHDPNVQHFAKELSDGFRLQRAHASATTPDNAVAAADTYNSGDPMELLFLEQLLKDTMESYHRRLRLFEPIVDSFLDKVANEVYSDTGVHLLVPLKDSLQSFELQVKQSYECLTDLLEHDDLMLALLLTEQQEARQTGNPVAFSRHEHVELLLGVYARQMSNILLETQFLLGRLQSKQEFVALALSGYRNRMIRINVHLGIFTVALGWATSMAGFFGMNLINGWEQVPNAFAAVVATSGIGGMLIAAGSLNYLSGSMMKKRATQRLDEIETLTSALGDMCAIDYAIKSVLEQGKTLDKEQFRHLLSKARNSKTTSKEVDLIFSILDKVPDGQLSAEDFQPDFGYRSRAKRKFS